MWAEQSSYNPEEAIKNWMKAKNSPKYEEWSTSQACTTNLEKQYKGDGDFEPLLQPTFNENGNQTSFEIPENEDPDNVCPSPEDINAAYN